MSLQATSGTPRGTGAATARSPLSPVTRPIRRHPPQLCPGSINPSWLYQNIGVRDAATELVGISMDIGSFTDSGGDIRGGDLTVSIFQLAGDATFVPGNDFDIAAEVGLGTGVTLIHAEVLPSGSLAVGETATLTATLDLSSANTSDDLFLHFAWTGNEGAAFMALDNIAFTTDLDGDGLPAQWEAANGLDDDDDGTIGETNPGEKDGPNGALGDPDSDDLTNAEEFALGTHPNMADTDMDDVEDGAENVTGTDPLDPDSDDDGLDDGQEVVAGTDPLDPDSDDDLFSDMVEIDAGSLPNDAGSRPALTGDGVLCLDGQSFVSFMNAAGLIPDGNEPFSIEVWANVDPVVSGDGAHFTYWGEEFDDQSNGFRFLVGAGGLLHYHWANDMQGDLGGIDASDDATGQSGDGWHHFAITYDGTEAVMYHDGSSIASRVLDGPVAVADANHRIGRKATDDFGSGYYAGYLDEIRIWNVARSGQDIADNRGQRLNGTEDGLVAYWSFDGADLGDLTGNGHDGGPEGDVLLDLSMNAPVSGAVPTDELRILSVEYDPEVGVTVSWNSVADQEYTVRRSADLDGVWRELDDGVEGQAGSTMYTDTELPAGARRMFYQVLETQ